jgi:hypothetical protein
VFPYPPSVFFASYNSTPQSSLFKERVSPAGSTPPIAQTHSPLAPCPPNIRSGAASSSFSKVHICPQHPPSLPPPSLPPPRFLPPRFLPPRFLPPRFLPPRFLPPRFLLPLLSNHFADPGQRQQLARPGSKFRVYTCGTCGVLLLRLRVSLIGKRGHCILCCSSLHFMLLVTALYAARHCTLCCSSLHARQRATCDA